MLKTFEYKCRGCSWSYESTIQIDKEFNGLYKTLRTAELQIWPLIITYFFRLGVTLVFDMHNESNPHLLAHGVFYSVSWLIGVTSFFAYLLINTILGV
eukprot:UN01128